MTMNSTNSPRPVRMEKNVESFIVAGLSQTYSFGAPIDGAAQWEQFAPHIGNIPGQKGMVAYGIGFHLDDGKGIEYMCAVEVIGTEKLPNQLTQRQIPARHYAVFAHDGHVSTIRQTLDAISKWLPQSDFEKPDGMDFFFERYGEKFDPKTGTGDIEIWVPVKA